MGYAESALQSELDKLAAARPGNQDNTINEVFFCIAQMVKGDWFTELAATSKAFAIVQALPLAGPPFTRRYCEQKWRNAMQNAQARSLPPEVNNRQKVGKRHYQNGNRESGHETSKAALSYPKASLAANEGIPQWTAPGEEGKPFFIPESMPGHPLPKQKGELRRHIYCDGKGNARRIKIKIQKQDGSFTWVDWYKVKNRRCEGWQPRRPAGYAEIPYFLNEGINPFDEEFAGQRLFWVEGEKDADNLARAGACAFSFGGSSTFIEASDIARGRHLVVLADNDEAGRKWAAKQASIVADACASIKTYCFPQLDEKGDASDFLAKHSLEELEAIIAGLPAWRPDFGYGGELLSDGIVFPPVMLINRILPAQGLVFAGGQSEAGKTYAMVSLAISLASGCDFLGYRVYNKAAVIYCAAEGEGVLANRFAVMKTYLQIDRQLPILILRRPGYINDDLNVFTGQCRSNADWLKRHFNLSYCVFILDTRAAGWRMEDENNNEEAAEVCHHLRSIGPEIGGPVVIVHHYGKTKEQGLRGASAWEAGCDHVISIYAEKDQVTGEVARRELAISRSRFGPTGIIGEFNLKYQKLGIGPHDEEFGDCYLEFLGAAERPEKLNGQAKNKGRPRGGRGDLILKIAIDQAIVDGGVLHAVGGDGPLVTAAKMSLVRDLFNQKYVTGEMTTKDSFNAQRKAWSRAVPNIDPSIYGTEKKGETEWIWLLKQT